MFDQAAELLEIQGENPFRVRAYRRAARVRRCRKASEACSRPAPICRSSPALARTSPERSPASSETGHFDLLDSLKKDLPGELGEIAAIPGSGPKRVKLLYDKLKVRTLDDLRGVLAAGRLGEIRGFGPIIEKKIFAALEKPRAEKRFKLAVAEAEALMYAVRHRPGAARLANCGRSAQYTIARRSLGYRSSATDMRLCSAISRAGRPHLACAVTFRNRSSARPRKTPPIRATARNWGQTTSIRRPGKGWPGQTKRSAWRAMLA